MSQQALLPSLPPTTIIIHPIPVLDLSKIRPTRTPPEPTLAPGAFNFFSERREPSSPRSESSTNATVTSAKNRLGTPPNSPTLPIEAKLEEPHNSPLSSDSEEESSVRSVKNAPALNLFTPTVHRWNKSPPQNSEPQPPPTGSPTFAPTSQTSSTPSYDNMEKKPNAFSDITFPTTN